MTEIIGKYTLSSDESNFTIRYRYTFSDIVGSFWYLLITTIGTLLLVAMYKTFQADSIQSWMMVLVGLLIFGFGLFVLVASFYSPSKGVFQVNKTDGTITVRDFLKSDTFPISDYVNLSYELKSTSKPRAKYTMLQMRLKKNKKIDCFIIRSSFAFDVGREVDKDLHTVSRKLRDRISLEIMKLKK